LHKDKYQDNPGWQRVKGAIDGKKIVLKFGVPPDTTIIGLDPRKENTIFVQRTENGKTRQGWLDRAELR
jgi:hypothetical protein